MLSDAGFQTLHEQNYGGEPEADCKVRVLSSMERPCNAPQRNATGRRWIALCAPRLPLRLIIRDLLWLWRLRQDGAWITGDDSSKTPLG